jgi:hypothetical protein
MPKEDLTLHGQEGNNQQTAQALDIEVVGCSNGITSPNSSKDKQIVLEDASGLEFKNSTNMVVECGVQTSHNIESM